MNNLAKLLMILSLISVGAIYTGCTKNSDDSMVEQAEDTANEAMDNAEDAMEDAGDTMEEAGDELEEEVE